jgi:transcription termination factor Rho
MNPTESIELLLEKLRQTETNRQFIDMMRTGG